jgi:hypothetical protein
MFLKIPKIEYTEESEVSYSDQSTDTGLPLYVLHNWYAFLRINKFGISTETYPYPSTKYKNPKIEITKNKNPTKRKILKRIYRLRSSKNNKVRGNIIPIPTDATYNSHK